MAATNTGAIPGRPVAVSLTVEMRAYDSLPRELRHAIATAHGNLATSRTLDLLKQGVSVAELIAAIERHNERYLLSNPASAYLR